jgi:hypothetical protein
MVSIASEVPIPLHKPIELLVPLSGSLFQTIQALRQSANHLFIALFPQTPLVAACISLPPNLHEEMQF